MRDAVQRDLAKALTGLRGITVVEDVGHWPQLEAADAVNRTLLTFLGQTTTHSEGATSALGK